MNRRGSFEARKAAKKEYLEQCLCTRFYVDEQRDLYYDLLARLPYISTAEELELMEDEERRVRERIKKRLYPDKANASNSIGNSSPASTAVRSPSHEWSQQKESNSTSATTTTQSSPASTPVVGTPFSESSQQEGSSTSAMSTTPSKSTKNVNHSTRPKQSKSTSSKPSRRSNRIQPSSFASLSDSVSDDGFEVKFLSFIDSPEDRLGELTWKESPGLNYRLEFTDSKNIFEPYHGIENLTNRGPQFVLDDSWNGKAYYDVEVARFEVFKTCGSRLRVEFMNQSGTIGFMKCFKKWFEGRVEGIIECKNHLGIEDFSVKPGSNPRAPTIHPTGECKSET